MKYENPNEFMGLDWYKRTHTLVDQIHIGFAEWFLRRQNEIATVLEVGCGMHGFYPNIFIDKAYMGIDNHPGAINYWRDRGEVSEKHCHGDIDVMDCYPAVEYDLVFSHAVIDHAGEVDAHLLKCVSLAKKYCYIMAYRGPVDPPIDEHKQETDKKGFHYNDLSISRIRTILAGVGKVTITTVPNGLMDHVTENETHILVEL